MPTNITDIAIPSDPDALLNPAQAGALLGLTRRQVYAYLYQQDGVLPKPIRVGKHLRWVRSELLNHVHGKAAA